MEYRNLFVGNEVRRRWPLFSSTIGVLFSSFLEFGQSQGFMQ
ncbi:hypothetical protein [Bacillus sp. B1-b2]|nr:hypothetical protein [Bacillus sp. B1-b2]